MKSDDFMNTREQLLEDAYWGELAIAADEEESLSYKKTIDFLLGDNIC